MITHISIPQYLLESSFCLAVFYIFYYFWLKQETYFQFNRLYLLGSAFLSLIIPLINIDYYSASQISGAESIFPFINQVNEIQIGIQQTITQESNILNISIADIINWVYVAGFFFMTLKLLSGLFKLFNIINKSPKLKDHDHTLLISEDVPAASFFSYIFWRDKHDKSDPIQKTIMDHELVHVRQWHSLDVVIMEIMVIIKWFNPLIYLFRNSLKTTHEFIADKYVTDQMGDKVKYANILLTNSAVTNRPPMSNHFYGNIKERIQMLGTKQSTKDKKIKYVAIIPMCLVLFTLFSFDLSDRLPTPIKTSFQNIENSMMAVIEKNVVSLNMDEDKERQAFHLRWSEVMEIKLNPTNKVQDFIFYYSRPNLDQLLSAEPSIIQNGKDVKVYIDTLELMTRSGKKEITLESLKDKAFRKFLIDSLDKHDQLTLRLKSYSDTDSLCIKLHIGLGLASFQDITFDYAAIDKTLKWGQRKILFNKSVMKDGRRFNWDESVNDKELISMLDHKLEISFDSKKYENLPDDMIITFTVNRANNSGLANIDSEIMNRSSLLDNVLFKNVIAMETHYYGKWFSIVEKSKPFTLSEYYNQKETFKEWIGSCENGDYISVKLEGPNEDIGSYEFNLRYRDENEAISAPFPIELPHTNDLNSNFQVVLNENGKSYVRIDTKDINNKSIIETYKGSESYEILHIDGFKTKSRVFQTNLPKGNLKIENVTDPSIADLNFLSLNDYYSDGEQLIRMDWGKMVSMPNIGNYSIKEFKRSSKQELSLFEGTQDIKMARFDLLIIPENGKIDRLRTDNINTQSIREKLSNVDVNTSIYIDNIIVDIEGELKYYPYNFVFTVE